MGKISNKPWLFAATLSLPMVAFFLCYIFHHSNGLIPTGFIQYDNVSYIAYSKQYLDSDTFHLQYNNPFNDSGQYSHIYFQTQSLLFATLMKLGVPAGWILIPFTIICTIFCFRITIAIYDRLKKNERYRTLYIWLLCWGGGLLTLSGFIVQFFTPANGMNVFDRSFMLDPASGWWGLNLGRSMFFSCEAYYHLLFLGCIYMLITKQWLKALLFLAVMSISHPFTGIELISILGLWLMLEIFIRKQKLPIWFIAGVVGIGFFHLYYYLIYPNQFPEHQSVNEQYSLNWKLRFYNMIPGYCLVAIPALYTIYKTGVANFIKKEENRLFACWFIAAFILANHEIFLPGKQPIHFTRGYIWTSLYLMGLPALPEITLGIKKKWGITGIVLLTALFLSDNILWIINSNYVKETQPSTAYITKEQENLYDLLNKESDQNTLIISDDEHISYLSTVYTKAYPWISHRYTTPFYERKIAAQQAFLDNGKIDSSWMNRNVLFIFRNPEHINVLKKLQQVNTKARIQRMYGYDIMHCNSLHKN